MTQEDILKRGINAAEVLNNVSLMQFFEHEKLLITECITNTQPFETKTREALYQQHHALTSFFQSLQQYVDAATSVVEAAKVNTDT